MGDIKKQTLSGVKWTAIENISIKGVTFVLSLVLARLLTPGDFGVVGLTAIFFGIANVLIDSGFGNALVRKENRTEDDYYTAFYFCFAVSVVCASVLCIISPLIAKFFNQPILTSIVRVSSLTLIIGTLGLIPRTKLYVDLNFKAGSIVNFVSAVTSGVIGCLLAYYGFGVWAIVWQGVASTTIGVILVWCFRPCRILFLFSKISFKELFGYGSRLSISGILHIIYSEMTTLAIGKFYSPASLGNYYRGTSIASLPVQNINSIVTKVTFPIFARLQNDNEKLINVYRAYISLIMMGVIFLCILVAALSKPFVFFFLTEKWSGAIIFIQIFAFAIMFDPICSLNLNLLQIKGRSDLFLRLEIIKKIIAVAILFAAIPFGVVAICVSKIIYTQIAVVINTHYTRKLFGLGYWQQVSDFSPYFLYSVIACLPAVAFTYLCPWSLVALIAGSILSTGIYIMILRLRNDELYMQHVHPVFVKLANKIPGVCY